jgi:hypothetical protein
MIHKVFHTDTQIHIVCHFSESSGVHITVTEIKDHGTQQIHLTENTLMRACEAVAQLNMKVAEENDRERKLRESRNKNDDLPF